MPESEVNSQLDALAELCRKLRSQRVSSHDQARPPGDLVGIGECGLDFSPWVVKDEADRDKQRRAFLRQVELAQELDLPLNVHSRNAGHHAINLLQAAAERMGKLKNGHKGHRVRAVLHAFDGRAAHAVRTLSRRAEGDRKSRKEKTDSAEQVDATSVHHNCAEIFFSVPPSILRDPQMQKLVQKLPLSALLLESVSRHIPLLF